ncbi:MAG: hypothetical protein KDD70_17440, partial [Bdellovibrionales bacterium]|nr:hypothetical protein [Bdellovibrionales bacterium]
MKTPSKNLPSTLSLRSLDIACIAAIFLITFAVYLPGLHNPFLGVEIPGLQHSSVFRELDTFAKQFGSFRALLFKPLTMLTFTLQFELFGADPFSFHLFNVLLHLVNTGLIYLIASSFGASRWIAAGVFALHPLQTSVGGLIYGRPYELGTFFFLLSLFIARRIFMGREFTLKHGILVSGLWCLMFLSKQVFVVFPAVVLWFWLCRPGVSPWHLLGQLF